MARSGHNGKRRKAYFLSKSAQGQRRRRDSERALGLIQPRKVVVQRKKPASETKAKPPDEDDVQPMPSPPTIERNNTPPQSPSLSYDKEEPDLEITDKVRDQIGPISPKVNLGIYIKEEPDIEAVTTPPKEEVEDQMRPISPKIDLGISFLKDKNNLLIDEEETLNNVLIKKRDPRPSTSNCKKITIPLPAGNEKVILPDTETNSSSVSETKSQKISSIDSIFDSNIVIKQEIIETESEPDFGNWSLSSSNTLEKSKLDESPQNKSYSFTIQAEFSNSNQTTHLNILNKNNISEPKVSDYGNSVDKNIKNTTSFNIRKSKRINEKRGLGNQIFETTETLSEPTSFVSKNSSRNDPIQQRFPSKEEHTSRARDEFDSFGELIALKMRKLDRKSSAVAQAAISNIVYEAELGKFLNVGDKVTLFSQVNQDLDCSKGSQTSLIETKTDLQSCETTEKQNYVSSFQENLQQPSHISLNIQKPGLGYTNEGKSVPGDGVIFSQCNQVNIGPVLGAETAQNCLNVYNNPSTHFQSSCLSTGLGILGPGTIILQPTQNNLSATSTYENTHPCPATDFKTSISALEQQGTGLKTTGCDEHLQEATTVVTTRPSLNVQHTREIRPAKSKPTINLIANQNNLSTNLGSAPCILGSTFQPPQYGNNMLGTSFVTNPYGFVVPMINYAIPQMNLGMQSNNLGIIQQNNQQDMCLGSQEISPGIQPTVNKTPRIILSKASLCPVKTTNTKVLTFGRRSIKKNLIIRKKIV